MAYASSEFSLTPGTAAPDAPFLDASGKTLRTKDILGRADGLPVLFAFFKVGCPTCKLAWPYLQKLNAIYGGQAVQVAGVCQNDAASGKAFYAEFGRAAFDLFVDAEPLFAASNAFGVESVPHLVLVSPDVTVERVTAGWSKKEIESLGRALAAAHDLTARPVVSPDDPVRDFQAG
jgi:peroxiredoxin